MGVLWPFLVIGIFAGSIYGLAAMGVVLTYKTAGVFNFAYGAVAMFCAFTYWQLHDAWHLTAWLALPLLLGVVAPLIGLAFERLFRSLVGTSAEIQIVVSLGILAVFQSAAPILYGGQTRSLQNLFPLSTFELGSRLHVGYDQLATVIVSLALGTGLWLLLRRTRFGLATRAVVDNRDLAAMIGVNANAVSRLSWVVSSVFAALVGVLLSPSQGLNVYVLVVVVIYSFAPAVLGRLRSLPLAYAGALILGVVQSVLSRWGSSGAVSDIEASIPYLALFVLLIVLGRRLEESGSALRPLARASATGPDALDRSEAARTDPRRSRQRWRFFPSQLGIGAAGLLAAGLVLPVFMNGPHLVDVSSGLVYASIALTLVILTGWAGQISLAQFSFVGVGAFTVGHLAGAHGSNFLLAAIIGALIAVPLGILVGLPSLRLSGLYLALATMAFALLMDNLVFVRTSVSGGYTGMAVARPRLFGVSFASTTRFYELALAVFAVFAFLAFIARRGAIGRRLQMLRDSPVAASTLGVNLTATKLAVFAVCGAMASFAGALYGAGHQTVSPSNFAFSASLELLLLVVLGGRSLVSGALIAGGLYAVQLLAIPASIERYIPLTIALGVVNMAQNPEGTVAVVRQQVREIMSVLKPMERAVERWEAPRALSQESHRGRMPRLAAGVGGAGGGLGTRGDAGS